MQLCENRLRVAQTSGEIALLYFELALYYTELKRFELSRVYAKKCIREGRQLGNHKWMVNGYMALSKISIQQHNKNDTKNHLQAAMLVAKEKKDVKLQEFLECVTKTVCFRFSNFYFLFIVFTSAEKTGIRRRGRLQSARKTGTANNQTNGKLEDERRGIAPVPNDVRNAGVAPDGGFTRCPHRGFGSN